MNRTVKIILAIVALLVIAGGSFYGGILYSRSQLQANFTAVRGWGGAIPDGAGNIMAGELPSGAGPGEGQALGGSLFGQIQEIGDSGLVLSDNNGKRIQVKVTDTTLIEKQASVTLADLAAGEMVFISGSTATDGTVTARSVQVAPAGRFGMGRPAGGQPGATPAP